MVAAQSRNEEYTSVTQFGTPERARIPKICTTLLQIHYEAGVGRSQSLIIIRLLLLLLRENAVYTWLQRVTTDS